MKWKRVVEKCEPFATSMPSISRPSGTRGGRALIEMLMALPTTGAGGPPIERADERTQRPRRERQKRPRLRPITCGNGGGREEERKEGPYRGLAGVEGKGSHA